MTSHHPDIRSHPAFRTLSNEFSNPYPPYVLVNSDGDVRAVLSTGCEPGYLIVLDADGPPGTKALQSNDTSKYKERIGVLILTIPPDGDLPSLAESSLTLLSTGGTAIGFVQSEQTESWKSACLEWAGRQKTQDAQGQEQDSWNLQWEINDVHVDGWVHWKVVKKAPEWAFC